MIQDHIQNQIQNQIQNRAQDRIYCDRRDFLRRSGHTLLAGSGLVAALTWLSGCQTMGALGDVGATIASATGVVTPQQAGAIRRSSAALAKTFEDITPEQEYYIGRTVGAVIVNQYGVDANPAANAYLNVMGTTLALASARPETFGGYHFLILNADEINAFAAPGGFIFISRGMLRCCTHEEALAAVLAHEIGHVAHGHGLQAIERSRLTSALTIMAVEGAKTFAGGDLAQLVSAFEDSITDITGTLIKTGYSRAFEREADRAAVATLKYVGYDPNGLVDMLQVMESRLTPGGLDFARTHPEPASRISDIQKNIGGHAPIQLHPARQARFEKAMAAYRV